MKPYYHTFEWKDRVITLCLIGEEQDYCLYDIYMGYSVKIPKDEMNEDFAQQIALGRATKPKSTRWLVNISSNDESIFNDRGLLKAIARNCERNIKNGTIVIKGIR